MSLPAQIRAARSHGLHTLTQLQTLHALRDGDLHRPSELIKEIGVSGGGFTFISRSLHQQKLIHRIRSTADRRIIFLRLSPLGKTALREIFPPKPQPTETA